MDHFRRIPAVRAHLGARARGVLAFDADVQQGDEVTIVGEDGGEWLTVEELAETAGSFNYEYVCDVTKRVPRVYIDGGRIVE